MSSAIAANSYFLLECTDDTAISDAPANQACKVTTQAKLPIRRSNMIHIKIKGESNIFQVSYTYNDIAA